MEYHVVDPETIEPTADHPCDRRSLTDEVDLSTLAAAVYTIDPGEQLPRSYHYHDQREELFYVLAGALTVETPSGEYSVPADSVFVAKPKSPHRPYNPAAADAPVRVLGLGAPRYDIGRPYDPDSTTIADE